MTLNLPNMVVKAKGMRLLLKNLVWSFALEKSLFCMFLVNFDISVDQVCRKHANRRDNSNLLKPNLKVFLCLHFAWLIFPKSKQKYLPRRICLLTICKPNYAKFSALSQIISMFRLMFFDQKKVSFCFINTKFSITQKKLKNP